MRAHAFRTPSAVAQPLLSRYAAGSYTEHVVDADCALNLSSIVYFCIEANGEAAEEDGAAAPAAPGLEDAKRCAPPPPSCCLCCSCCSCC